MDDDASADDVADDDDADDDDADDDAASDDDTEDDADDDTSGPETFRLLIIGHAGTELKSWEQDGDGWREWNVPQVQLAVPDSYQSFGPVLVREGRQAYSAVNGLIMTKSRGSVREATVGHAWIDFDSANGWQVNNDRPSVGEYANITQLQLPLPYGNELWAAGEAFYYWADSGIGPGPHFGYYLFSTLNRYRGENHTTPLSFTYRSIQALAVPAADFGLAWMSRGIIRPAALWLYDGQSWTEVETPVLMAGGNITWFWFDEPRHGFASWTADDGDNVKLLETDDGVTWREVASPEGCASVQPSLVFAAAGYAIALDTLSIADSFWELRDGTWTCRQTDQLGQWAGWQQAVITTDGRVFVAAHDSVRPALLEVTAEEIRQIALPEELTYLGSVHVLGDGAPAISYAPAVRIVP